MFLQTYMTVVISLVTCGRSVVQNGIDMVQDIPNYRLSIAII